MTGARSYVSSASIEIVRVELSRFILGGDQSTFAVCYVTADGRRGWMWSGSDYRQAIKAAGDCAGPMRLPILNLVQEEHRTALSDERRAMVEAVRTLWDGTVAAELADDLGVEMESAALH